MTMAPTCASASKASSACPTSSIRPSHSAFRALGRFSWMKPTFCLSPRLSTKMYWYWLAVKQAREGVFTDFSPFIYLSINKLYKFYSWVVYYEAGVLQKHVTPETTDAQCSVLLELSGCSQSYQGKAATLLHGFPSSGYHNRWNLIQFDNNVTSGSRLTLIATLRTATVNHKQNMASFQSRPST